MAVAVLIGALFLLLLLVSVVRLRKLLAGTEIGEVLLELAVGFALFGLVFVLYR